MKITLTKISKVKSHDRFEPRFHKLFNKLDELDFLQGDNVLRLGDENLLLKITDGEHAGQIFLKSGVRFLKNSAVRDFSIDLFDGFFISEEKHLEQSRSALKANDILFTTIGHLGSAAIIPEDFGEANINQNVVKLEINEDIVDPYYLTAYLNSKNTKVQIEALFTGNIHRILTYPKIKDIKIMLADKEYQEKISSKYKKAIKCDKKAYLLIQEAEDVLHNEIKIDSEGYNKAYSFSVNIKDIEGSPIWNTNYFNPKYKKAEDDLIEKYQMIALDKLATIKKGNEVGSINYIKYLNKSENDIPFIRTSDIVNYEADLYPDNFIPLEIYNELEQDLLPGDIIFSNDGRIGHIAIITTEDKAIIQSHIKRIRITTKSINDLGITQEYLFILLNSLLIGKYQVIRNTVIQSTIGTLSNRINDFKIPILPSNIIQQITNLVKEAFALKAEKKCLIKEVRNGLDEYFDI